MSLFGSHRDDRRRRTLAEDRLGDTPIAPITATPKPGAKVQRYTDAGRCEHRRRTTDFVPRSTLSFVLTYLAALTIVAGLLVGYSALEDLTIDGLSPVTSLLDAGRGDSLASWFSSLVMLLCAAGSVLVFSIRRHRLDDYRGSYRLWLWSAAAWLVMSIDATANLHRPFSLGMAYITGWSMWPEGAIWWIGVWGTILSILALRLVIEVRGSRTAMLGMIAVMALWSTALATNYGLPFGTAHDALIAAGCRLAGQVTLLLSIGVYARYVLLDAEGLLPTREEKTKKEKPAKKSKESAKASSGSDEATSEKKATRVEPAHQSAAKRTDLQPHAPATPPAKSYASYGGSSNTSSASRSSRVAASTREPDVTLPQRMTTMREAVDDFRRQLIEDRLATYDGNCAAAARSLGLDRGNFHRLMKKLGLRS